VTKGELGAIVRLLNTGTTHRPHLAKLDAGSSVVRCDRCQLPRSGWKFTPHCMTPLEARIHVWMTYIRQGGPILVGGIVLVGLLTLLVEHQDAVKLTGLGILAWLWERMTVLNVLLGFIGIQLGRIADALQKPNPHR